MTLWELEKSHSAKVTTIDHSLEPKVIARLNEMGLAKGEIVQCIRRGPLGGPMVTQLSGSVYAIEKAVADFIQVSHTN